MSSSYTILHPDFKHGGVLGVFQMRVLFLLSALILLFSAGCTDQYELTGPWEMWVLVSSPAENAVWTSTAPEDRVIRWAAIPGDNIRCELYRNGEAVMEIFQRRDIAPGVFICDMDLGAAGKGDGFSVVIHDNQGFYGTSGEFSIR